MLHRETRHRQAPGRASNADQAGWLDRFEDTHNAIGSQAFAARASYKIELRILIADLDEAVDTLEHLGSEYEHDRYLDGHLTDIRRAVAAADILARERAP